MRLGAIDIGSNAIRLLVADAYQTSPDEDVQVKKVKLFRLPIRLGTDAFIQKNIGPVLMDQLIKGMKAFQLIMQIFGVEAYRAYATSALREAENKLELTQYIQKESGIHIEIISGKQEAKLILSNKVTNLLDPRFNYLYVDVGGGSTEVSLLSHTNGIGHSKSFKIGTVRLLHGIVPDQSWTLLKNWLAEWITPNAPLAIIGSGGNINRVFKRANLIAGEPLRYDYVKKEYDLLKALSIEERVAQQNLNKDRAEVIVLALDIFLLIMEQTNIQQVLVPKIGLADGMIRQMYKELNGCYA